MTTTTTTTTTTAVIATTTSMTTMDIIATSMTSTSQLITTTMIRATTGSTPSAGTSGKKIFIHNVHDMVIIITYVCTQHTVYEKYLAGKIFGKPYR